jgi:hypothetical protein
MSYPPEMMDDGEQERADYDLSEDARIAWINMELEEIRDAEI